ncbi:hypothetical protein PR202_ga15877 [Eleusine coracana subsp. coracana]|uniref:Transmembrane protein n=1 Tax=Eleusine coracana subsp. coracana TaxID=191504 RepID=A0AAV5CL32_ELECO|nr:hypothetical protein PR202_ga15877 [Eleusine coracana subsp. coracana]
MAREATDDAAAREAARSAALPAPTWGRVRKAGQGAAAHALLLCFTALLALKLDGIFTRSWWVLFIPLWSFHAVASRCNDEPIIDLKLVLLPLLALEIITLVDNFR